MKKITAILLVAVLMMTFLTGCGKTRELYSNINLADYVEVGKYIGLELDTTTEEYARLYANGLYSDIYNYQISNDSIKSTVTFDTTAETAVELGDMVNIDYKGYKDGVAFEGGTATGGLLVIGSQTFIDDFEDQLVGVKVGQTVDVNVTFPENYSKAELAGADAKFVVTVNAIAKNPEQIYKLFNLDSQEKYVDVLDKRVQQSLILNMVRENSTIKDYPTKEAEKIYQAAVEVYASQSIDISKEDKTNIFKQLVYPMMDVNMVMYYILDTEKLEIYESTLESQKVDQPVIAESYAVQEIVIDYILDNTTIK